MALPTKRKTWTIDPSNQIAFVSLNATMAAFLFELKVFLKANGYTVDGSCDGVTGAMDGVDRWTDATKTNTQGAAAGNAQSWIVLKDANNVRILFTYQGASADVCRISFADSAFTPAGSPNQQPTHANEQVLASAQSVINSTTSGDRRWHGWVDSSSSPKAFRFAVSRANVTASCGGVEDTDKTGVAGTVTWTGTFGHFSTAAGGLASVPNLVTFSSTTSVKRARPTASGVPVSASCFYGSEVYNTSVTTFSNVQPEMQGNLGYPLVPMMLGSTTTSAQGKYGELYDSWLGRNVGADGDVYGTNQFVVVAAACGLVWPWDSSVPVWA